MTLPLRVRPQICLHLANDAVAIPVNPVLSARLTGGQHRYTAFVPFGISHNDLGLAEVDVFDAQISTFIHLYCALDNTYE